MKTLVETFLAACVAALLSAPGAEAFAQALRTAAQAAPVATPAESLRVYLEREASGLPGRVEVTVGTLDPRISLGECTSLEPFLPTGARLWGRSTVGLRCGGAQPFTAFLPVTVKVHGPALVAARPLPAGAPVAAGDLRLEEVELTREPPGALADAAAIGARVLARPLATGQVLRADYLRVPPAVQPGDMVKVLLAGPGFSVSTEGRAVNGAAEGQTVRVQTSLGKTLSGVARAGKIVQVGL